jgi:hypothetical protein
LANASSIEDVQLQYFQKALRNFTNDPIDKRIKTLVNRLGVPADVLFSQKMFHHEIKMIIGQWNADTIIEISNKRNTIVHDGKRPYSDISELQKVGETLQRLLMNIGSIIAHKLGIPIQYGPLLKLKGILDD